MRASRAQLQRHRSHAPHWHRELITCSQSDTSTDAHSVAVNSRLRVRWRLLRRCGRRRLRPRRCEGLVVRLERVVQAVRDDLGGPLVTLSLSREGVHLSLSLAGQQRARYSPCPMIFCWLLDCNRRGKQWPEGSRWGPNPVFPRANPWRVGGIRQHGLAPG